MTESVKTQGELLFERYLETQNLPFEFEKRHEGKSKRPDYTLSWQERTIILDVKDFAPKSLGAGYGAYDPYPILREKIDQGRQKFREYKEFPCALVLYNSGNPLAMLHLPEIMLGSMYGDSGFEIPFNTSTGIGDTSQLQPAFLGRGKMLRSNKHSPQNTTISALVTLSVVRPHYQLFLEKALAEPSRHIEECEAELRSAIPDYDREREIPRVIVWHSAVARMEFPENLFCGAYDSHFGVSEQLDGTVVQSVTYRGSCLPSSIKV